MNDASPEQPLSFEAALAQLETIVHQLEDGQTGLAESLAKYEEGVRLLRQCYGVLEKAERKIELLTGVDAEGNPKTVPFDDHSTMTLEENGTPRNQRRARSNAKTSQSSQTPQSSQADVDDSKSLF